MVELTGRKKCAWRVGEERAEKNGLDGNCKECKHYRAVGVHHLCFAPSDLPGRVTAADVCVLSLKSKDNKKACLFCKYHFRPATKRCQECVKTDQLENFNRG